MTRSKAWKKKLIQLCRKINLKLAPDSIKFGGTIISSEKIANQQIVFLDTPDSWVLAITEMPEPKTKKELQNLCGMISSMRGWLPNIIFSTDSLRMGCAHGVKFQWTKKMQEEFDKVK